MKEAIIIVQGEADAARAVALAARLQERATASVRLLAPAEVTPAALADVRVVLIGEACGLAGTARTIEQWVQAGGALVAFANASACEDETYVSMLGARCAGVSPRAPFNVNISDPAHEIVRGFKDFRVTDRFLFLRKSTEVDLHWLLSGNWQGQLLPLAYAREYGKGRVFYTALGSEPATHADAGFIKLLHRAVWWTTRSTRPGPVRCGIIGYGAAFSIGKWHADTIRNTRGLELTALCEMDGGRLETARKDHPCVKGFFRSPAELAQSGLVDVATVATPHNTHAAIVLDLLAAGIGVICEKPFSITVDQATRMIEAARERNVLLTVYHNRRWDADYLTLRDIIARGLIGEPFQIEAFQGEYRHPGYWWRSDKQISGGSIYDWGAHFVDWILHLMPYRMESVTGFCEKRVWHDVTNEDHCRAIIRFEGGRSAELEISHLAAVGKPKWRILGTHGGLTAGWDSPAHVISHVSGSAEKIEVPYVAGGGANEYYSAIVDHLLGGEPLAVTPESARRVIAVLELAGKSSRTGHAEPVPFE